MNANEPIQKQSGHARARERGWKTSLVLAALVAVGACGCRSDSGRAYKMQTQSGRVGHQTDYAWYAVCRDHQPSWQGPKWRDKEKAMQQALEHNREHSGHQAVTEHD